MTPDYQHDVFISYKRDPIQDAWTREHFVPLFSASVREAITAACGRPSSKIFFDQADILSEQRMYLNGIELGCEWREELAKAIKSSRCCVALWSPLYFYSDWCMTEWSTFRARAEQAGTRLVIGVSVYDGDTFPDEARAIQQMDFNRFNIIGSGFERTELYVTFQQQIRVLAKHVAEVVKQAPPFRDWPLVHGERPRDLPHIPQPLL